MYAYIYIMHIYIHICIYHDICIHIYSYIYVFIALRMVKLLNFWRRGRGALYDTTQRAGQANLVLVSVFPGARVLPRVSTGVCVSSSVAVCAYVLKGCSVCVLYGNATTLTFPSKSRRRSG